MKRNNNDWDIVLSNRPGWLFPNLSELWRYRDLIAMFTRRDLSLIYKQTVLGPIWYIIKPLASSVVFTVIFGRVARISTDELPQFLFYMSGTILWGYFSRCLISGSNTLLANAGLYKKAYFPRLAIPLSQVVSNMVQFLIQFLAFIGFLVYYTWQGSPIHQTVWIAYTPLILLQMACLGTGFGLLVSSLTVKYRDLTIGFGFGVSLWMYASPIVYPMSQVPDKYRLLYSLNPMATVVEAFRCGFLGAGSVNPNYIFIGWAVTVIVLLLGLVMFSRSEKTFIDTV